MLFNCYPQHGYDIKITLPYFPFAQIDTLMTWNRVEFQTA